MSETEKLLHALIEILATRVENIETLLGNVLMEAGNYNYQEDLRRAIENWNTIQDKLQELDTQQKDSQDE